MHRHHAAGGARQAAPALLPVQADLGGQALAHCDAGGTGVDHELHRFAVDAAARNEVAAGAGSDDDLTRAAAAAATASAQFGHRAQAQQAAPAADFNLGFAVTNAPERHALDAVANRQSVRLAADHQQRFRCAQAARQDDALSERVARRQHDTDSEQATQEGAQGEHALNRASC